MDGIILLLILVPLLIIILLIAILAKTSAQQHSIDSLSRTLSKLSEQLSSLIEKKEEEIKPKPIFREEVKPFTPPPIIKKEIPLVEKKIPEPVIPKPTIAEQPLPQQEFINEEATEEAKTWQPKWIEKNSDFEKFIGENLANKIGIAVLVLGIAFFVKYAIDKNWINETGRVVIGLISGGILIGFAHYFRNSYRSFSSVLVGGGLAVFYFTIAFAFHQYHLISQQAAFVVMIVITAFAITLSVLYDRLELAILAMIGGFITPFLVSTGTDNYIALFTYLCILNAGLTVLSWFKRWPVINTIALVFTVFIYGGWLINRTVFDSSSFPYSNALFFASLFYLQLGAMNLINNLKLKRRFTAFDFIIVLTINFLFYAAGIVELQYWNNGEWKGLFTAVLAVVNFFLAFSFFKSRRVDKNFVFLLIGLTMTFVSLVAPVQLKGNHITLFWAAETVLFFWLYQQSRIEIIKYASLLVAILTLGSLFMDWSQIYFSSTVIIPVVFNKGFITTIAVGFSLFIYQQFLRTEANWKFLGGLSNMQARKFFLVASLVTIYLSGVLEIYYQFDTRYTSLPIFTLYLQLYSFCYALLIMLIYRNAKGNALLKFILAGLCYVLYLLSLGKNNEISAEMLQSGNLKNHFLVHWLSIIFLFVILYDTILFARKKTSWPVSSYHSFATLIAASVILLLSVEMHHVILWLNYNDQSDWFYWENLYDKAGLTIVWGVCSFIMMWLGMKNRFRILRILSLGLFTITLIKLFVFDISNIPPGGKIAAFILLGFLLLIVSFMYQRLKKILIEDVPENK
jgi:uncharacterized membrane protein